MNKVCAIDRLIRDRRLYTYLIECLGTRTQLAQQALGWKACILCNKAFCNLAQHHFLFLLLGFVSRPV